VDALIAMTDGSLTLANLSSLFRRARLMQALSLSPDDLSAAIALTGIDPFAGAADTGRFIAAVTAVRESGFTWRELDYLLRHRFQSPAPIVPSDDRLAAALSEIRAGLLAIAPANAAADRALVFERLAATLALPEIAVGTLMGGRPEMDALIALRELAPDEALSRANASAELDLLHKLTKIALIVTRLSLPGDAWRRVAGPDAWIDLWNLPMADTDASPLSFDAWFQLVQFRQLRRALETTDGALESILRDQAAIAQAPDDATRATAKAAFVSSLVEWLGWTSNDVQALIGVGIADQGILGVSTPADYRGPALLLRMAGAIAIVKTLGVAVTKANGWCDDSFTADHAAEVRAAAVARHDEQTWRQIARPLQDRLRNAQRTALVDYLVARPALWRPAGATDPADRDDLYARLLIDVEMDACQLTSRLVQATGSAQLFGQRCLMGLEGVATDDEQWRQWQWMKNYRVWEANRKIWLYPENWIRPELRDGKSPFFEELEQELLQEEITDATAEAAVRRYLEKLDQVGRLEIVGLYEDDETHVLHVFGRTFNSPRVYFHRQAVITESSPRRFSRWTPWRKVDLEIEGDHLIPVVRNRRLTLIWPVFTEKQDQKPVRMPEAGGTIAAADKYWDLHLAWSEYRDGRWSATNVSEDVALRAYQGRNDVLFGTEVRSPGLATNVVFRCNDPENMGCPPPDPSDDNTPPPPTTGSSGTSGGGSSTPASLPLIDKRLISFKAFVGGDSLTVRGYISLAYATPSDPEVAAAFGEFRFAGCRDIVTAFPRSYIESRALPVAPAGTRWDAMGFDQRSGSLTLMDGDFPVHHDLMAGVAAQDNRSGSLFGGLPTVAATKASRIDIPVFRATPSHYRLLAPHQDLQFKGDRPFAFMDRDHTLLALSDGASGFRPDFRDWVVGDLSGVWTAAYFGTRTTTAPSTSVDAAPEPLLVLARGADGRRIARQIVTADIAARPVPVRIFPRFWTTRRYRFVPFAHPFTCEL
jgi:hypothetical protein